MKRLWDVDELAEHWSLTFEENQLLKTKPVRNHLAFVAQLKHYQNSGRFALKTSEVPETPLHYLADQLDASVDQLYEYDWLTRTAARHRREILDFLGVQRVTAKAK